jgi:hypothetical protein
MMLSDIFECSPMRVPLRRYNGSRNARAVQRAAGASRLFGLAATLAPDREGVSRSPSFPVRP